jgi:3',5'-cyclic AMP phosphodiesterase CpdA
MRVMHISDLHFQADIPLRRFPSLGWRRLAAQAEYRLLGRRERFLLVASTVDRLLADAQRLQIDHLLVSGDLTALALWEEFEAARAALESWSGRMTILPGNHDVYTPRAARERLFETAFDAELRSDLPDLCREGPYPIVKLLGSDAAIVALSSARVPLSPGIAAGWVGEAQRGALEAILADPRLSKRAVLVSAHHGPFRPSGRRDRITHGLRDAREVLTLSARGGAVGFCHGHIHHRYRIDANFGIPIFCGGSSTQKGQEGYWIYDLAAGSLRSAEPVWLSGKKEH